MISVESLSKSFGNLTVFKDFSIQFVPGQIHFVMGRSGTGKSVLLKHLVGLLLPDSGKITIDGEKTEVFTENDWFRIRRKCALIFQFPALLDSLSIQENLLLAGSDGISQGLEWLGLGEEILPKFPYELSQGTQKRVSVLRAMLLKPNYLLFDEPTTGLDPVATRSMNHLIQRLVQHLGVGAIVVSHDMQCALEIADRVSLIEGGGFWSKEHLKN